MKRISIINNSYAALVLSLLLVMVLYSICRLLFYGFNMSYFPDMTPGRMAYVMWGGLRFDLTAVLYSNILFILMMILPLKIKFHPLYQKTARILFITVNSLALAANAVDFIYYRFTLRRTTLAFLAQFKNEKNKAELLWQFLMDYWYILFCWLLLVTLLVWLFSKIKITRPQIKSNPLFYLQGLAMMMIGFGLFIGGARGGYNPKTRPISLIHAAAYAKKPSDLSLVLNTPFALIRTANEKAVTKLEYFKDENNLSQYFNPVINPVPKESFRKENVMIFILESFSKEFSGIYNKHLDGGSYKGYTPFLDSLISVGMSFQYSMANGRKSIDALPSINAAIPAIDEPYVVSHFAGNRINSLSSLLKEKGYYSAFFHGAHNGSMCFDSFVKKCEFDDYFGKDEYNNDADYDGVWGIWDEKFMQFAADKINTFPQPFYSALFSVSSHHPFKIPREHEDRFNKNEKDVLRATEYADYSLRQFFKKARTMPWFKNTLFVFTADHASAEIGHDEYNTPWGYFAIPIFFYKPGQNWGGLRPSIFQQIDIMPSVLGYLHYDKPYVSFGRDCWNNSTSPFAFNYLNDTYQAFAGHYFLIFNGKELMGLYNFVEDKMLEKNLLTVLPDTAKSMEYKLKAFIQQYNNRMVDNRLTVEAQGESF